MWPNPLPGNPLARSRRTPVEWSLAVWERQTPGCPPLLQPAWFEEPGRNVRPIASLEEFSSASWTGWAARVRPLDQTNERALQLWGSRELSRLASVLPSPGAGQALLLAAWVASHESLNRNANLTGFGFNTDRTFFEPCARVCLEVEGRWSCLPIDPFAEALSRQADRRGQALSEGKRLPSFEGALLGAIQKSIGQAMETDSVLRAGLRHAVLDEALPAATAVAQRRVRF